MLSSLFFWILIFRILGEYSQIFRESNLLDEIVGLPQISVSDAHRSSSTRVLRRLNNKNNNEDVHNHEHNRLGTQLEPHLSSNCTPLSCFLNWSFLASSFLQYVLLARPMGYCGTSWEPRLLLSCFESNDFNWESSNQGHPIYNDEMHTLVFHHSPFY